MASRAKQLECRVVITHAEDRRTFALGMYDPISCRYEPLGSHSTSRIDGIVRDLVARMEREGHRVSFSETTGKR